MILKQVSHVIKLAKVAKGYGGTSCFLTASLTSRSNLRVSPLATYEEHVGSSLAVQTKTCHAWNKGPGLDRWSGNWIPYAASAPVKAQCSEVNTYLNITRVSKRSKLRRGSPLKDCTDSVPQLVFPLPLSRLQNNQRGVLLRRKEKSSIFISFYHKEAV